MSPLVARVCGLRDYSLLGLMRVRSRAEASLGSRRGITRLWSVALCIVLATGVVACGASANSAHPGGDTSKRLAVRSQAVRVASAEFGPDVLDVMFPRDGQDLAQQVPIDAFALGVDQKQEAACLAAVGFPAPGVTLDQESLATAAYGSATMPNLPLMVRTGTVGNLTSYRVPPGPEASMPQAERSAYVAMLGRCSRRAFSLGELMTSKSNLALVYEWDNAISAVQASAAVRALNARAAACTRHTAFSAGSVEAMYGAVILAGNRHLDNPSADAAAQAAGVRVMARCFGADIAYQARVLTAKRAAFFAANASAIHAILSQVNSDVARLERAGDAPRSVLTVGP